MRAISILLCLLILFSTQFTNAQERIPRSASEIQLALEKLKVTGRVLYVAAHPDDENTRLISWLANEKKMETAYLSLTRGDGGQNLIGTEKGQYMGVLRTQELLEARKIDGGKQFFTRAVDFGYSKSSDETLEKWDKDQVLADVVWVIRKFRPDVIITRFPPNNYAGHGHHSASAILAEEAFDLAADKKAFAEQLDFVEVWQPKRLYFNTSTWWNKNLDSIADVSDDYLTVDVGTFNPLLGKWHTEIAGESRSMHKSQGFGAARGKGQQLEYLKYVKGDKAKSALFEDIATDWSRVEGGNKIVQTIEEVQANFNPMMPQAALPQLLKLMQQFESATNFYETEKRQDVKTIIQAVLGLNLEALAESGEITLGQTLNINFEMLNQSNVPVTVKEIVVDNENIRLDKTIVSNLPESAELSVPLSENKAFSQPYWLRGDYNTMFQVEEQELIGKPENDASVQAIFKLEVLGVPVSIRKAVQYKWTDRVEGEKVKPLTITPPVVVNFDQNSYIFNGQEKKSIKIIAKSYIGETSGKLSIAVPDGWQIEPKVQEVSFEYPEQVKTYSFTVTGNNTQILGELKASFASAGKTYSYGEKVIEYPHIPQQYLFPKSTVPVSYLDIKNSVSKVGYVMGAGDDIPQSLEQIGITVDIIEAEAIPSTNLKAYGSIILGIRAINTEKALADHFKLLLDYVENGGNLIVQYNTNRGLPVEQPGPYPIHISRDRVTVEEAPAEILTPTHAIFNYPNQITDADFEHWVQERGLYFADEWSDKYTAHISWNDPGETPKKGSLLSAYYGQGTFVFTGISFFRQLPAGVPGAYRLFANLINFSQGQ